MTSPDGLQRKPSGARAARIHTAALEAAAALLNEGGLAAATADAIAARAGVSKATLYNPWPSRLAIASEAYSEILREKVPPADTGSLEGDVLAHVEDFARFYSTPLGQVLTQLLAAAVDDEAGSIYFHTYLVEPRRALIGTMYERGVERGEIDPAVPLEDAIDVLLGPLIYRRLVNRTPLTPDGAALLARITLRGLLITPPHPAGTP